MPQTKPAPAPNSSLTLVFKWSQVEPTKAKVERRLAKKVKLAGFRQGKVPLVIAQTYLNPEAVIEATLEKLLPDAFVKQVKALPDMPIAPPEYVVKKAEIGQDWQVEAVYAIHPDVKLGNYQQIARSALKEAKLAYQKLLQEQTKTSQTSEQAPDYLLTAIYRQLVTNIKPLVQELLVRRETQSELNNLFTKLKSLNLSFEDYLKKSQLTMEQLSSEIATQSLGRLQLVFILQAIAKTAQITVTEAELDKQLKEQKTNQSLRSMTREHLLRQKIASHLLG